MQNWQRDTDDDTIVRLGVQLVIKWSGVIMRGNAAGSPKSGPSIVYWLPLASLVAIEIYVRNFDGWGAWSTAPLFLLPVILSFAFAGAGAAQCFLEFREGAFRRSSAVSTAIALIPFIWILVRRHLV